MTRTVPNYGKITDYKLNRFGQVQILSKFVCKWNSIGRYKYVCKTMRIIAPTIDLAIEKASALMGYKPSLIQRI